MPAMEMHDPSPSFLIQGSLNTDIFVLVSSHTFRFNDYHYWHQHHERCQQSRFLSLPAPTSSFVAGFLPLQIQECYQSVPLAVDGRYDAFGYCHWELHKSK